METDFKLGQSVNGKTTAENIWPICHPKNDEEHVSNKGFVAGWFDSPPIEQESASVADAKNAQFLSNTLLRTAEQLPFFSRVSGVEKLDRCEDPSTQKNPDGSRVNTYYPPGTVCYVDPSHSKY